MFDAVFASFLASARQDVRVKLIPSPSLRPHVRNLYVSYSLSGSCIS